VYYHNKWLYTSLKLHPFDVYENIQPTSPYFFTHGGQLIGRRSLRNISAWVQQLCGKVLSYTPLTSQANGSLKIALRCVAALVCIFQGTNCRVSSV
jgi:hypothetical protein